MKILFTRFPLESTYGGAELQTLSLMKGLLKRGHAVAFLGSCPVLLHMCRAEGIPAAELQIGPPPVTKAGALTFTWRKHRMRKLLQTALAQFEDLDVICMLSMSEKLLLTPFATQKNIKVCWIEHDRIGRWLTHSPWLNVMRDYAELATTVAVSSLTKKAYIDLGWPKNRIVDIVNGIDAARLGEGAKTVGKPLRIGCIARLSKDKGVDLLLEAMRSVPQLDLAIVGKGPDESHIKHLIHDLNRDAKRERITLEPTTASVGNFYRSVDALVLPSPQQDPFGMAPVEALWLGVPIILTDVCGAAHYLRHGEEAIIVRANSVSALRHALEEVQNDSLRACLSEQGKAAAHRLFSIDRMVDEYETLFAKPLLP